MDEPFHDLLVIPRPALMGPPLIGPGSAGQARSVRRELFQRHAANVSPFAQQGEVFIDWIVQMHASLFDLQRQRRGAVDDEQND